VNSLPEGITYPLRRFKYMFSQRDRYLKFKNLRDGISDEGYTLQPFDEYQCIFIHVPKCAGQSIRQTLFEDLQPGHINAYTYQLIYPRHQYQKYYKFSFVRNPWDRLVSAFFFMISGGAHKKDRLWMEKNLSEFPDFSSFIREGLIQDHIMDWPHFRPQVEFLKGQNGKIELDFIGRFENIESDFKIVRDHLGINRELAHINKTQTKREPYRTYYTDELRDIVAQVYSEDIQTFEYRF
jgi:hypothetical protein